MHPRQRGVAHVNIFWSLIPFVLMIGAIAYGYMKHVEADENMIARRQAEQQRDLFEFERNERNTQLRQLTAVLGNAGPFPVTSPDAADFPEYKGPTDYTTPEKLRNAFATFNGKFNNPSSLGTLDEVLSSAATVLNARMSTVTRLEKELGDTRGERDTTRDSLNTVRNDMQTKVDGLETNLQSERAKLDRQVAEFSTQLAESRQKTREAVASKEAAVKDANEKLAGKDKEILGLTAANLAKAERLKLINSPHEPDGRVLSSSPITNTAWIDIGAKDLVKVGLTFRVVEPVKNGSYRVKGSAYVADVENDRAKIKVTSLVNPLNPVVQNDRVTNDLYSPNLKRHVYLLGRFATPYTKGEVRRILENMGNIVHDRMNPSVDLLIMGRQPIGEDATKLEDTDQYKMAIDHRIEIATLTKIRDFLKL